MPLICEDELEKVLCFPDKGWDGPAFSGGGVSSASESHELVARCGVITSVEATGHGPLLNGDYTLALNADGFRCLP